MDPINPDPPPVRPNPGTPIKVFLAVDALIAVAAVLLGLVIRWDFCCLGVYVLPILLLAQQVFVSAAGVWDPALPVSRPRLVAAVGVYGLLTLIHLVGLADSTNRLLDTVLGGWGWNGPTMWLLTIGAPWLVWVSLVGGLAPRWPRVTFYKVTTLSLAGAAVLAGSLIVLTRAFNGPWPTVGISATYLTTGFALGVGVIWLNLQYALTGREKVYLRCKATPASEPD